MAGIDDIAVLTSENVRLTYTLANLGSRMTAFIIDFMIVIMLLIGLIAIFRNDGLETGESRIFAGGIGVELSSCGCIYFLASFVLWGYWFFFEWINWGQTPGKQAMGIRVSAARCAPADLVACAVRNVVRFADMFLAAVGVTFLILIFTPRYQRLGDLAAGTVVVKRRKLSFDDVLYASKAADRASSAETGSGPIVSSGLRLTDAEVSVVSRILERRETLPPDVRRNIAKDLADRFRSRLGTDALGDFNDEGILQAALSQARRGKK